ncbi:hypothetical protein AAG570_013205 [Ranatra chinensis]|uniref:Uncharacterized protein n=1 Tax=Ranatra chinensis TaxID=642074 RepID=A0ABD0YUN4_9HEMI
MDPDTGKRALHGWQSGPLGWRLGSRLNPRAPPSSRPTPLLPRSAVKSAPIEAHSISKSDRTYQLLGQQTLGDRKPSEFLAHLRRLGGNALPPYFLRALWMLVLLTNVRAIHALAPNTDLQTLASQAEQVLEEVCPIVETVLPGAPRNDLYEEIEVPKQQLRELKASASHHPPPITTTPASGACLSHRKFGDKAAQVPAPLHKELLCGKRDAVTTTQS